MKILFTAFPDFTVMTKQISADAQHVWVEWVMEGTHEGTCLGIAPTHRRIVIRGASALLLRNSKVVEERRYWGANHLLRQLG
jgi:predicted ester cyclase